MLLCARSATSTSGASGLDMAPPAAAAALRAWPLLPKGIDSVAAAQKPQPTLLKAVEGRPSQNWERDRERLNRSLRVAGLNIRWTAQPSDCGGNFYPVVLRLELLAELLRPRGPPAKAAGHRGAVDFDPFPGHVACCSSSQRCLDLPILWLG